VWHYTKSILVAPVLEAVLRMIGATTNVYAPGSGLFLSSNNTSISGDSPWQDFGVFFGPIQKHTWVFHNENGVFIPWTTLCCEGQSNLLQSCDSLINSGSLTSAGDTAVGWITNGVIISALAASFNIPLATIKGILGGQQDQQGAVES
jgi:hypothetical protein